MKWRFFYACYKEKDRKFKIISSQNPQSKYASEKPFVMRAMQHNCVALPLYPNKNQDILPPGVNKQIGWVVVGAMDVLDPEISVLW